MTDSSTERWLTVDEIRERLRISRTKAYEIATNGSVETVKIGRLLRVNEESFTAWLSSQRHPAA